MKRWWWLLASMGCADKTYSPCQDWRESTEIGFQADLGDTPIHVVPPQSADPSEGAPTAIFVHGGWEGAYLPLDERLPSLRDNLGFTTIYLDFPEDDVRGADSRSALARVLQYAVGERADDDDCTLNNRLPTGSAPHVALAGFSNGGNIVWTAAGDPDIDIPVLSGIATFETPVTAGFILGEPGTKVHPNPRFDTDTCNFDDNLHLSCPFDLTPLGFAGDETCDRAGGCLFIDANGSDVFEPGERVLGSVADPLSDRYIQSPWVTAAAEAAGILPGNRANYEEAHVFWAEREATQGMASAALRFPKLGGISTGTAVDHVLNDLPTPVHIIAMVAAMQTAGVAWTRLHPAPKYMQAIHGDLRQWAAHPANEPVTLDTEGLSMEPEDDQAVRGTDYLSAAITELLDRSRTMDVIDVVGQSPTSNR
jgi:hypothetical protein